MIDNIFIYLLASFGLSFLIKENDGPFNIIGRLRNLLMTNKYIGVFFYKLLSCWFCLGCWTGAFIYFLIYRYYTNPFLYIIQSNGFRLNNFIIIILASGTFNLILSEFLSFLNMKNN